MWLNLHDMWRQETFLNLSCVISKQHHKDQLQNESLDIMESWQRWQILLDFPYDAICIMYIYLYVCDVNMSTFCVHRPLHTVNEGTQWGFALPQTSSCLDLNPQQRKTEVPLSPTLLGLHKIQRPYLCSTPPPYYRDLLKVNPSQKSFTLPCEAFLC